MKGRFLIHPMLDEEKEYIWFLIFEMFFMKVASYNMDSVHVKKTAIKKLNNNLKERFIGEFKEFLRKID